MFGKKERKKEERQETSAKPAEAVSGIDKKELFERLNEAEAQEKKKKFRLFPRSSDKNSYEQAKSKAEIERYFPSPGRGLSSDMVRIRNEQGLKNTAPAKYTKSVGKIIRENSLTYFNILMISLAVLMLVFSPYSTEKVHLTDFTFVFIVFANLVIGVYQQIKAKITTDRMKLMTAPKATVVRNSETYQIPPEELVLDDIVILKSGEQVATDCILKSGAVEVNESQQTGESKPVPKKEGDLLLSGSLIVSGKAVCQVNSVGEDTFMGQLAKQAKSMRTTTSALYRSISSFIRVVSFIVAPIGVILLLNNYSTLVGGIFKSPFNLEMFSNSVISSSSSMIGMIPSGLVLLTSVALSVGVLRLAKENTLVQDIYSIERLARVDCVCFDKTGTLTDELLTFEKEIPLSKKEDGTEALKEFLGALAESENKTSLALADHYGRKSTWTVEKTLPFSSERKYSAVSFSKQGVYVLGAPEMLLEEKGNAELFEEIRSYQQQEMRVLVFLKADKLTDSGIAGKKRPLFLLLLSNHIRESAKKTIQWFLDNNVEVKVISGDSAVTVASIARRAGVPDADRFVSLAGLSLEQTAEIADKYSVFGRVSPEQKAVLVHALKAKGHTVAMTGDGINDILAMKEADCAVGMANGAAATRSAAHVILLDSDFSRMSSIVFEGRRVVNNIQSSASLFIMKTLFVVALSLSSLLSPFFGRSFAYPLRTGSMLILETLPIGIDAFFLGLQPNGEKIRGKFFTEVVKKAVPPAICMFVSAMICIAYGKDNISDPETYAQLTRSMIVLTMDFSGFMMVLTLCLPFNLYRFLVFFLSAAAAAIVIAFDKSGRLSSVDFSVFSAESWRVVLYLLIGIFVLMLGMYFTLYFLSKRKQKKESSVRA